MDEEKQILVKFVTKLPAELKVSEAPVAVPTTLKRYGLSQIINHLLGLEPARPFDFVIHGELVRKSLEAHLTEHQLSAESLLEVEYVPAVIPPKHKQSAPHDDWVSAVDGSFVHEAVSGSYDGCARLWSLSSSDGGGEEASCSTSWKAHASGINALACSTTSTGQRLVVTAGKDRAVLLWQLASGSGASPHLVARFAGHTDSVEAVAISPDGRHLVSSGWDGSLRIWRMGQQVLEEAAAAAAAAAAVEVYPEGPDSPSSVPPPRPLPLNNDPHHAASQLVQYAINAADSDDNCAVVVVSFKDTPPPVPRRPRLFQRKAATTGQTTI
mmetsp:Transcript_31071/g.80912  ORF Transcript_31071/g.80912 Transcript_31071/m.80912 type:complete len:326 (+) Transcript_31071:128-1105(+)